jgi:membrane-bound ClpP family serine protease
LQDADKNGFMHAVHGLDKSKGLDLLLHTPGGDFAATESIGHYLRQMFGTNIRCFIPQLAMSGGTMIACAGREIFMGKESNIGPIDPQFGGIPAHGVIDEFEKAIESIKKDPASIPLWQTIISKYHPTFIGECRNAIDLATDVVTNWLISGMFQTDADAKKKASQIVKRLNNHADTKMHARHIHAEEAASFGLKISMLEEDDKLQDIVLTIHHSYMHTFSSSAAIKIVENHLGRANISMVAPPPSR